MRPLENALERSGENRPELEAALKAMPGRDMEHLIRNARQFDLVNLTSQLLVTNIVEARQAFSESRLVRGQYDYEMFLDYVLPYRVLEEDLSNWRPFLREQIEPVIKDARTVEDAALRIQQWLWEIPETGEMRMLGSGAEFRNKNSVQLLHLRHGACKEKHITFVSALRAVGIPARHCTIAWWGASDWYHYFAQYYDSDIGDWRSIAYAAPKRSAPDEWNGRHGRWHVIKAYAFPPYPSERDLDGMQRFDLCTDITKYLAKTGEIVVRFDKQGPFEVGIYTWNLSEWRLVDRSESENGGPVVLTVGETAKGKPILVAATSATGTGAATTLVNPGESTSISLIPGQLNNL